MLFVLFMQMKILLSNTLTTWGKKRRKSRYNSSHEDIKLRNVFDCEKVGWMGIAFASTDVIFHCPLGNLEKFSVNFSAFSSPDVLDCTSCLIL